MASRILIIEDDLEFAGQLKTLCESRGYSASVSLTMADGLRVFRERPADLIILDLKLPDGHGIRTAEGIRNLPGGGDVPIIVMSGVYRRPELFDSDMRRLGIDVYLPKPFSFEVLMRDIEAAVLSADGGRGAVRSISESTERSATTAYARTDTQPAELHEAVRRHNLRTEDTMLRADSARRLPQNGALSPEIWVRILTTVFHSHSGGRFVRLVGEKKRTIYLLNGYPVWAEGPTPEEGVLRFLRMEGVLDNRTAQRLAEDLTEDSMSLRALLKATGLGDDDVDGLLEDWVAEEVRNALRHRGEFEFTKTTDFVGKVPIFEINPIPTLWEGLEAAADRGEVRRSLDDLNGRSLGRTRHFEKMFGYVGAAPSVKAVGELLEHPRLLRQIRAHFPDDPTLNLAVWFLLHSGLISVSDSPKPLATPPAEGRSRLEATEGAGIEVAFDELARPARNEKAAASSFHAQLDAEAANPTALIERHYATRLDLDHYGFLGINRDATMEEIDAAYQSLAPRYRSRNLGAQPSVEIKKKAKALLARLVGAFSELSDGARRRAYDRLLERELGVRARSGVFGSEEHEDSEALLSKGAIGGTGGAGLMSIDLTDWTPGADDESELARRCASLDEVDAEKLREAHRAMRAGAFSTAFGLLDQLREQDPSDVVTLSDIAWCQFSMDPEEIRSVDKAIEWVDLGLAFEPSNVRALAVKTRILCHAQREAEAHAALRRLAPLMPNAEWVRFELARRNDSLEEVEKSRGIRRFWGGRRG